MQYIILNYTQSIISHKSIINPLNTKMNINRSFYATEARVPWIRTHNLICQSAVHADKLYLFLTVLKSVRTEMVLFAMIGINAWI